MGGISATIFYDRNNTAFSIDPNGNTGLNRLWVTPRADYYSWTGADLTARSIEVVNNVSWSGGEPWLTLHHWGYGGPRFRFNGPARSIYLEDPYGDYTDYFRITGMHLRQEGGYIESYNSEGNGRYVRVGAAWGVPGIYVDSDLYLNSESRVIINDNNQRNWYFDGSDFWRNGWAHIYNTGSNFHLDAYNGGLYLQWYSGYQTFVGHGLQVLGTAWCCPWRMYPNIYANADNHTYGGIAVSDDGGFFDFNDGWIRFRGRYGLLMDGYSVWGEGCPPGYWGWGDICMSTGLWGCSSWGWVDYWCKANYGGHLCTDSEINGMRAWIGWWGWNEWFADACGDNCGQFHNCNCGSYWYDHDGSAFKGDCRNWACCINK